MQRAEVDELLDQLHEVLDERFEAGPAPYVIDTMTAEPSGSDEWAAEVVYEPAAGASRQGLRVSGLDERSPLAAAWDIYRYLESGAIVEGESDEHGVRWTAL